MALQMVTRAEWGAMPGCHEDPLRQVIRLGFVHSASLTCHDREECCKLMRFMQRCHMGIHQMADMKHNFYIARDGTVYEGRGWKANTSNYDPTEDVPDEVDMKGKWITIARIGLDFQDDPATPEEIASKEAIIKYGIEHNYISPDYKEVDGLFYQFYGDSEPPEVPSYEVWKPPPCSEKERILLHNCTSNSAWDKMNQITPIQEQN